MEPKKTQPVVPINTEGLSKLEIENAILQVLALGRQAVVDKRAIEKALWGAGGRIETAAVTQWANGFAAKYQFVWKRRRLFEDLLFALAQNTPDQTEE